MYRVGRQSGRVDTGLPRSKRTIGTISSLPHPGPSSPDQLGAGSYQDFSTFKESQQDDPGDPWLQARDNVTMEPSLTCLEPPAICMSPSTTAAHQRGKQSRTFPPPTWHHFCHLIFGDVDKTPSSTTSPKVCVTHRAPLGTSNSGALTALRGGGTGKPASWHGTV